MGATQKAAQLNKEQINAAYQFGVKDPPCIYLVQINKLKACEELNMKNALFTIFQNCEPVRPNFTNKTPRKWHEILIIL